MSASADGSVLVIGGGLAGITAALDCADAGADVPLVEVRRRLGGAAYSVQRGGLEMDNGQHVFLRCCEAYRALLARIGSDGLVSLQDRLEIPVLSPGAPTTVIRRGSLPAPAHLGAALARYPHLSLRERFGAVRAALALRRLGAPGRGAGGAGEDLDTLTMGAWLERHGQGAHAQAVLWDLIALPTLNLRAAKASLALGAFVFHEGLLTSAGAADIGFHDATLGEIIDRPAARALEGAGVRVLLGWRAERLQRTGTGFELHGRAGEDDADGLGASAAIVALPHARAARLLEPLLGGERTGGWSALGSSPIVNLHVLYDREVMSERFAAGVGTPVQYLFDRSVAAGAPAGMQYLAVSLSGAEREMSMSVEELREEYLPALRALLPRARQATVETFLVTREHAATFRAEPGTARLRPGAVTDVPGLVLAGTWTATSWPATLESAVLSGHSAAAQALASLGEPEANTTARRGATALHADGDTLPAPAGGPAA